MSSISKPSDSDLVASYVGLLVLATGLIYAGAWSSVPNAPKDKQVSSPFEDDEDDEDEEDRVSRGDAYLFPIIGSCVLGGLYLIFKYFGKEWINWLLGIYFSLAGIGSVWKSSINLYKLFVGRDAWRSYDKIRFLCLKRTRELASLSFRTPSIILLIPSAAPSVLYYSSSANPRPALLSNVLAMSFAHNALTLLKLDGFGTGCILLAGLFVYDVWWVFGTDVMVSVATGLDVPIKLLWPKAASLFAFLSAEKASYTMLGLGDVVIPGAFVTLCLRYDLYRSNHRDPLAAFPKPYFTSSMVAYVVGLGTTMLVMHVWKAAQPALLYLSPACILSFLITAALRGELKAGLEWKDEPLANGATSGEYSVLEPKMSNKPEPNITAIPSEVQSQSIPSLISSKPGDDFVSIEAEDEKERDENDSASESQVKRRKGKKKKN